jgi:ASC-1-like (ASCH) protein
MLCGLHKSAINMAAMLNATPDFIIGVKAVWFDAINSGRKTVEGKKASETWRDISVGDLIEFRDSDSNSQVKFRSLRAQVVRITSYPSGANALDRFLTAETLAATLPDIDSIEEGRGIYLAFPGWTEDIVNELGMIAIGIEVIEHWT